jgi:hypothetical protein
MVQEGCLELSGGTTVPGHGLLQRHGVELSSTGDVTVPVVLDLLVVNVEAEKKAKTETCKKRK